MRQPTAACCVVLVAVQRLVGVDRMQRLPTLVARTPTHAIGQKLPFANDSYVGLYANTVWLDVFCRCHEADKGFGETSTMARSMG